MTGLWRQEHRLRAKTHDQAANLPVTLLAWHPLPHLHLRCAGMPGHVSEQLLQHAEHAMRSAASFGREDS